MIWKIIKKELFLNIMTFKLALGCVLCVILMIVFIPALISDYQQSLKNYNKNVAGNERELRKVMVYKNIIPTLYRPPMILSVFNEGLEKQLDNSIEIEMNRIPEIDVTPTEMNPYLSIFPILDVTLIFKVVASVFALLMAYDVISGEKEQGTLKLIMSNTIGRYQVLIGKLIAGLIILVIPITIAFIVGLLILLFSPMVDLTGWDWACIALMYLTSVIFISAMYNISLLFSCLTRKSAISLVLALFVWIVSVIVVPNGSVYLAKQLCPSQSEETMESQSELVTQKLNSKLKEMRQKLPKGWAESNASGAFNKAYVLVCNRPGMEYYQNRYAFEQPLRIKYADKFLEVKQNYLNSLLKQKHLAKNLSRISPITLYENAMSALAGTDIASVQYFKDKVKIHRNKVIEYIRSKTNNFSSLSYFTPCKEGDWEEQQRELTPYKGDNEKWINAYMKWKEKKLSEISPLNLQDLPTFVYQPDIIKNFQRAIFELSLLIFVNVLFFAFSFVAFVKYDIR